MSKHDFTWEEFARRRERVRAALAARRLDWYLAIHPVAIRWLTGSDAKSYQEFQCLLISAQPGPVIVFTREGERAEFATDAHVDELYSWGGGVVEDPLARLEPILAQHGVLTSRVGLDVPGYYLHPRDYVRLRELLGPALAEESPNLIHDLTLVKSPRELEYIRRAARIADDAMGAFAAGLAAGRSELSLAGDIYQSMLHAGGGLAASPINLVSGERSCYSHGAPTERLLRAGDYVNVEYGAAYRRYTATIGRQASLGPPTARMRELYEVVRKASAACLAEIRDGAPATVPHEAARRVIVDAGLEAARVHTTGYGLAPGFPPTWGEPIHMLGGSSYTLRAGMVVTIEPPVFVEQEQLGARLIDNVLVTESGAELLTRFPPDLIVVN
ncbi:MAG: Xaa-Pro peptidase family protein [Pirellulales bacterium]